jgi:predicted O-methyltransferase YrrM
MLKLNQAIGSYLEDPEGYTDLAEYSFKEELKLGGWCPATIMSFLNTAVSSMPEDQYYLEIGSWCGRSLCAALKNNDKRAIVIDPLDHIAGGKQVFDEWSRNVRSAGIEDRVALHRVRAEQFIGDLPSIGIFFYDGSHDSGHTYEGLSRYERFLADEAIIIVDDYFIYGGNNQQVLPGHSLNIQDPVKADTDRWIAENKGKISMIHITKFLHGQAIIHYKR